MSEDLKPCPFCGSDDVSEHYSGGHVTCKSCTAEATPGNWNTRHIKAADVPQHIRNEIVAEAVSAAAWEWSGKNYDYPGAAVPAQKVVEWFEDYAAKLRERNK